MIPFRRRLRSLVRLLTGEDIFISYARVDGARYAVALAEKLEKRGFTYYFDRLGSQPGVELPEPLKAHLRNASMMALVCSQGAGASNAIRQEIDCFLPTKGTLLLVGDGAVGRSLMPGLAVIEDDIAAGASDAAVADVARAFVHTRLMVVRRRIVFTSAIVLAVTALTVGWWLRRTEARIDVALKQLTEIEKVRDETARNLDRVNKDLGVAKGELVQAVTERKAAFSARDEAVTARDEAETERAEAVIARAQAVAEREIAAAEATKQRDIATARQFANRAVELAGDADMPVRAPLLTALESLRHGTTPEAIELVQRLGALIPEAVATHQFESAVDDVAVSASGRWYAAATRDSVRLDDRDDGLRWEHKTAWLAGTDLPRLGDDRQSWVAFNDGESLFAFTAPGERQNRAVMIVSLQDVKREGTGARAKLLGETSMSTNRFFFTRDGTSIVATVKANPFSDVYATSASALLFHPSGAPAERHERIRALDASAKWVVGVSRASEAEEMKFVIVDRSTKVRTTLDDGVLDATILGDRVLITATDGSQTHVFDIPLAGGGGARQKKFTAVGSGLSIDVSADGSVAAALAGSNVTRVSLNAIDRPWSKTITPSIGFDTDVRMARDGSTIFAASVGRMHAWDVVTGQELASVQMGAFDVSASGAFAVTRNGAEVQLLRVRRDDTQPDDLRLEMLSADGRIAAGKTSRGHEVYAVDPWKLIQAGHQLLLSVSARGTYAAIVDADALRFVDLTGRTPPPAPGLGRKDAERIIACAFSGDERSAAVLLGDGGPLETTRVVLVDVGRGTSRELPVEPDKAGVVFSPRVALSPRASFLALTLEQVTIYSASGQKIYQEKQQPWERFVVAFSPDETLAAVGLTNEVVLVDLRTGAQTRSRLADGQPHVIAFARDSNTFFAATPGALAPRASMPVLQEMRAVHVFDRAGTRIAHLYSPWPIAGAAWLDDTSLRVVDGGRSVRTLTWNAPALISSGCASVRRDAHPLPAEVLAQLPTQVAQASLCTANRSSMNP